ncbi:MAG TPA: hypothetical protein VFX16_17825, partial [Pseudonocardiaceae bacterium]|nr:hypothetical protein [Pseudonocardiaceae bacterium]
RQVRYIASLNADTEAAAQPGIDAMTTQAHAVDDLTPMSDTPLTDLPFGVPAPYWLDLREYHQVDVAATLDIPILVLQGGRDYQVTVADDLVHWQAGLAARPRVTFQVYDADDHLFLPGSGPSKPTDYETPQHVDPEVINDLTGWLTADRP